MPEKDEKGDMINPHIPNYIASVPWYIDPEKKPSLFHQHKLKAEAKHTIGDWYHRGVPMNAKAAGRFRKGKPLSEYFKIFVKFRQIFHL